MAHILNFDTASSASRKRNREQLLRPQEVCGLQVRDFPTENSGRMAPNDYWPEVACGLWMKQPATVNPENTPARVLTEMAMVLGGAGLLVVLTIFFFGMPYA